MLARGEVHAGDAEHLPKSFGRDRHRAGGGSAAGRGLRERRGHRGMEGDVALDLLHHLVNVPVEHSDRSEALQDRESLRAVLGAPAPFGVNGPQRNVREDDNRCAGGEVGDVLAEPFQLLRADRAESFQLGAVVQTNEMYTLMVKALPGLAGGRFAEAFEKQFAVVAGDVMFAWDIEHFFLTKALKDLVQRVKFGGLGKMSEVARVENQVRLLDGGVDLIDGHLQGTFDVSICRLVEADVAVADLNESEVGGFGIAFLSAEELRAGYAAGERPYYSGAGPLHTLQKAAAVHLLIEFEIHSFILSSFVCYESRFGQVAGRDRSRFRGRVWGKVPVRSMEAK